MKEMNKKEMISMIGTMLNKVNTDSIDIENFLVVDLLCIGRRSLPTYNREKIVEIGTIKLGDGGEKIVEILPNGVIVEYDDGENDNMILMRYEWLSHRIVKKVLNYVLEVCVDS